MTTPSDLKAALVEAMARAIYEAAPTTRGGLTSPTRIVPWDEIARTENANKPREQASAALASLSPAMERFGCKALERDLGYVLPEVRAAWLYVFDAAPTVPWEEK